MKKKQFILKSFLGLFILVLSFLFVNRVNASYLIYNDITATANTNVYMEASEFICVRYSTSTTFSVGQIVADIYKQDTSKDSYHVFATIKDDSNNNLATSTTVLLSSVGLGQTDITFQFASNYSLSASTYYRFCIQTDYTASPANMAVMLNGNNTMTTWAVYKQYGFVANKNVLLQVNDTPSTYCGDGICNGTEEIDVCITDCGASVCGDDVCEGNETELSCAVDCLNVLPMTSLQDTYLRFSEPFNSCLTGATCVFHYSYDLDIFDTGSDFIKVYHYASSTADPTYLGVAPISTSGTLGRGFIATSSVATSTYQYFQVVPCQFDGDCYGTSTVAYFFADENNFDFSWLIENNLSSATSTDSLDDQTKISGLLTIGTDFLIGFFRPFLSIFYNVFPFNVPVIFLDAWADSADQTLPDDLDLFNSLDNDGNISLTLPISASPITVFGPDILLTESVSQNHYTAVRSFSTYLIWFLFAMAVYYFAKRVIDGLDEERAYSYVPPLFTQANNRFTRTTATYRVSKGRRSKSFSRKI